MARPSTSATAARHAPFVHGSITRHLVRNTVLGAVGLMALFLVDFADLWFVSQLGDEAATAALGLAGAVVFFHLSLGLGLGIAAGALVAIQVGRRDARRARSLSAQALRMALAMGAGFMLGAWVLAGWILSLLGAEERTLALGTDYLRIVAAGFPFQAGLLIFSFTLRGLGMPGRAMTLTLTSAMVNAALDPLFIFGLDMGLAGAGLATLCAFVASFLMGAAQLLHHYARTRDLGCHGVARTLLVPDEAARDRHAILRMAIPVTLTQLATPVMTGYMLHAAARYGADVVAAMTVINRLSLVAFGVVFSLSGAVGPIIGQNYGARRWDRVRRTYVAGLAFAFGYTLLGWLALYLSQDVIIRAFRLPSGVHDMVGLFCSVTAGAWVFTGGQFVAQAAFNNLERPRLSMMFNWARAILGTMVPVELMMPAYGMFGILLGTALGWTLVGLAAMITAWRIIRRLDAKEQVAAARRARKARPFS